MWRMTKACAVSMIALGVAACQPHAATDVDAKADVVDEATAENGNLMVVRVVGDSTILFDDQPITLDQLDTRLAELAARDPKPDVTVRSDLDMAYPILFKVVEVTTRHGFGKTGFILHGEP